MNSTQTKLFLRCLFVIVVILLTYLITVRVTVDKPTTPSEGFGLNNPEYSIKVYYFPSKKNVAMALAEYFSHEKYRITIASALSEKELFAKRYSPYYLFFNNQDTAQAMSIKTKLEQVIGYPINGYRRSNALSSPSMILVLTDKTMS